MHVLFLPIAMALRWRVVVVVLVSPPRRLQTRNTVSRGSDDITLTSYLLRFSHNSLLVIAAQIVSSRDLKRWLFQSV